MCHSKGYITDMALHGPFTALLLSTFRLLTCQMNSYLRIICIYLTTALMRYTRFGFVAAANQHMGNKMI